MGESEDWENVISGLRENLNRFMALALEEIEASVNLLRKVRPGCGSFDQEITETRFLAMVTVCGLYATDSKRSSFE